MQKLSRQAKVLMYFILAQNENGIVDITKKSIELLIGYKEASARKYLVELESKGMIEIKFLNGFYMRLIIKEEYEVPAFIFLNLDLKIKEILAEIKEDFIGYRGGDEYQRMAITGVSQATLRKFITMCEYNKLIIHESLFESSNKTFDKSYLNNTIIDEVTGFRKYILPTKVMEHCCKGCEETNPEKFAKTRKTICRPCYNKEIKEKKIIDFANDLPTFFAAKLKVVKSNASNRKGEGIKIDLSVDDLIEQYNKQNGLCYYCDKPFDMGNQWEILTIDRVDSDGGYTKDNIVLCYYIYNTMKSNLTPDQFKHYINQISFK